MKTCFEKTKTALKNDLKTMDLWKSCLKFSARKGNVVRSAWEILGVNNFEISVDDLAKINPELYAEAVSFSPPWMSDRLKFEAVYESLVEDQREEIEVRFNLQLHLNK